MQCPICGNEDFEVKIQVKDHSISKEIFDIGMCTNCQMHVTLNPPGPEKIGAYYASDVYISHSDTTESLMDRLYHRVRQRMLARKHQIVSQSAGVGQGKLLDIGSGTGYFPAFMSKKGWTVEAIEVDPGARKLSIDKFGLQVYGGDKIGQLDACSYDAITMWHVLEHVDDIERYFQAMHNALKDDGVLIIAVPNHESWDARKYGEHWAAWDVPRHLWHFAPQQMQLLAEKYVFRCVDMLPMPMDAHYVSMLSEKYKGRSFSLFRGAINGLKSNMHAQGKPEKSSSVIYILKKQ